MRLAIRQKLIDSISEIGDRVYEPHVAGASTQKPYLVLRQGVEAEENLWAGFRRIVEVWPYVARTTFRDVDKLVTKVTAALDNQLLTTKDGEAFTCQYLGTAGQDFVDKDWDAVTRGLRFAVLAVQPVAVQETGIADAWIESLAMWSRIFLGTGWTVYQDSWPMGYVRPSMLWRPESEQFEAHNSLYSWRSLVVAGDVLGNTLVEQMRAVSRLAVGLRKAIKIEKGYSDKTAWDSEDDGHVFIWWFLDAMRWLTVESVSVANDRDTFRGGQLRVTLKGIVSAGEVLLEGIHKVHIEEKEVG